MRRPLVYLIGAGPGDPGLITVRGSECLALADVVLYDYLVNPRILSYCRAGAELVCVGRHGRGNRMSQDQINEFMVQRAESGKVVARLKGGDPAVFACGAQECEILQRQRIPFEVVPGITAALAAGSCTGIPLTHSDLSSAVALVTAREKSSKVEMSIDYAGLARFPGTIVMYMGTTSVEHWSQALIDGGKSPTTPVAVVRRCSWPDQYDFRCTLGDVAEHAKTPSRIRPPVVFIIGDVVASGTDMAWFQNRPLFGKMVLVTRPVHQSGELTRLLEEQGAGVLLQPTIEIRQPDRWEEIDQSLDELDNFDWIVFSSANGVDAVVSRMLAINDDLRSLGRVNIAAVGQRTADHLKSYYLSADRVPESYEAEALADTLSAIADGKRFLVVRTNRGRDVLQTQLQAFGAEVETIEAYRSEDVTLPETPISSALVSGQIDWVTVTSSAIGRSLIEMFGEHLHQTKLVSISPITSQALREHGFEPHAEAEEFTMNGVVEAIVRHT